MKKYLMGIFAVVLAIGFSAFTPSGNNNKSSPDLEYYWYDISYNGNQMEILPQPHLGHYSVAEAIEEELDCGGDDRPCKAGFSDELPFEDDLPVIGDDGEVHFDEEDDN